MLLMMMLSIFLSLLFSWYMVKSYILSSFLIFTMTFLCVFFYSQPLTTGSNFVISKFIYIDGLSNMLLILSFLMILIMLFISTDKSSVFILTHIMMLSSLLMTFTVKVIFYFYFFFEVSLLPISLMILGWGYQPERLSAYMFMFIYTVASSLPLLLLLIFILKIFNVSNFYELNKLFSSKSNYSLINFYMLLVFLGFLVKFPMYGLHLWLPKAHVEAPVGGSMVLASLLLKLGGFGMISLSPLIPNSFGSSVLMMFSAMGGFIISILCLRQVDMKVLIAYSSVAHLSVSLMTCFAKSELALYSSMVVMIAHGISSPGMFLGSFQMYTRSHSRNILMNSSFLSIAPTLTLWWFLLCLANMGAPPTINLMGELLGFMSMYSLSISYLVPFSGLIFFGGAYTLIVFSSTQQGQKKNFLMNNNPFTLSESLSMGLLSYFSLISLYLMLYLY